MDGPLCEPRGWQERSAADARCEMTPCRDGSILASCLFARSVKCPGGQELPERRVAPELRAFAVSEHDCRMVVRDEKQSSVVTVWASRRPDHRSASLEDLLGELAVSSRRAPPGRRSNCVPLRCSPLRDGLITQSKRKVSHTRLGSRHSCSMGVRTCLS